MKFRWKHESLILPLLSTLPMQLRSTIFSNPALTSPCATGLVFLGAEAEEVVREEEPVSRDLDAVTEEVVMGRLSEVVTEEVLRAVDLGSGSGEAMLRVVASTTSMVSGEIMVYCCLVNMVGRMYLYGVWTVGSCGMMEKIVVWMLMMRLSIGKSGPAALIPTAWVEGRF